MAQQPHPLRAWRQDRDLTLDQIAALLAADGGEAPAPAYLRHIENGVNSPGWALAKRIATLIGADPVAVKDWQPATDDKTGEAA